MPKLDHATFIDRLKGRSIDVAQLRSVYPDLNVRSIAGDGVIEGTTQNIEKLWELIDNYDHDGNVNTISDPPAYPLPNGCSPTREAPRPRAAKQ